MFTTLRNPDRVTLFLMTCKLSEIMNKSHDEVSNYYKRTNYTINLTHFEILKPRLYYFIHS